MKILSPKEFYKTRHPEEFSDSVIIRTGKLDKDFFAYYLDTLTSKNLENAFEDFCRKLAENEICPNLIPHTGPTGGGDSKVDTETYPVSDEIAERWYVGEALKNGCAASERWAFAISAKKDWNSKVKSDVKKIIKVNADEGRDYKKIFFMSNQLISDKKRAGLEDEFRKNYGIDVRILDGNWIIERTMGDKKNMELAVESFGLSDTFKDEVLTGSRDASRQKQFDENEERMKNSDVKVSELVSLSRENIILARELEYPYEKVKGLISRNRQIADRYGSPSDKADAIYEASHTVFWWYDDPAYYLSLYEEYEKIAINSLNSFHFHRLITMWMNLYRLDNDQNVKTLDASQAEEAPETNDANIHRSGKLDNSEKQIDFKLEEHLEKIKNQYVVLTSDPSKPNTALEARASYQNIRIFIGDPLDEIIDDMSDILDEADYHLDVYLDSILEFAKLPIKPSDRFNAFFEKTVSYVSKHTEKVTAARLIAQRAEMVMEDDPYMAINLFSRTLMSFYNTESKRELEGVLFKLAGIFETEGLYWAERNFYLFDFCLCFDQYMKYGEVSPVLVVTAHALAYLELRLGHMMYAVGFYHMYQIAKELYPYCTDNEKDNNEKINFDALFAIRVFQTPFDTEKKLGRLADFLDKNNFPSSFAAIQYEYGYYNEDLLKSLGGDVDKFENFIHTWQNQKVETELVGQPWYGVESEHIMETNVLGCHITMIVHYPYDHGEIEIGSTLLASIESFLGTGIKEGLYSSAAELSIDLIYTPGNTYFISFERNGKSFKVIFSDYRTEKIVEQQKQYTEFITKFLATVAAVILQLTATKEKLSSLMQEGATIERTESFANSIFFGIETLGKDAFLYESFTSGCSELQMKRAEKHIFTKSGSEDISEMDSVSSTETKEIKEYNVHYGRPPKEEGLDYRNVRNDEVYTSSVISLSLWDAARWQGTAYLNPTPACFLPGIAFMYENEDSAREIFQEWKKKLGAYDRDDKIGIRIIKKIDKNNPYFYRVAVGENSQPDQHEGYKLILSPTRYCMMRPTNNVNLAGFEKQFQTFPRYIIMPGVFTNDRQGVRLLPDCMLQKNKSSLKIFDAYKMEPQDIISTATITAMDDPLIPSGQEKSFIVNLINERKNR